MISRQLLIPALPAALAFKLIGCTPLHTPPKLEGIYSPENGNGRLVITVQNTNGFHYILSVWSRDGTCLGNQEGDARFTNDSMAVWGDEKKCHLDFKLRNKALAITEKTNPDGSRFETHGLNCRFDGLFLKEENQSALISEFFYQASSALGTPVDSTWLYPDTIDFLYGAVLFYKSGSEEFCPKAGSIAFDQDGEVFMSQSYDAPPRKLGTWSKRSGFVTITRTDRKDVYFFCSHFSDEGGYPSIFINTSTKKTIVFETRFPEFSRDDMELDTIIH